MQKLDSGLVAPIGPLAYSGIHMSRLAKQQSAAEGLEAADDNEQSLPPVETKSLSEETNNNNVFEKESQLKTALVPYDSLQHYLAEIRRYPLLTPTEEHELAVRYKEYGDIEAAYRLVTGNLRLVVMIARQYQRAFRNLLDLVQEGNIGLMEAVRNFDPYRGVRFPSYAVWSEPGSPATRSSPAADQAHCP